MVDDKVKAQGKEVHHLDGAWSQAFDDAAENACVKDWGFQIHVILVAQLIPGIATKKNQPKLVS